MLTHIPPMPSTSHVCGMASSPLTYLSTFFISLVRGSFLSLSICRRVFRDAQGTLHIRAAVPEDAGNYSCYASSALGWDEQVITLEFTGTCSPSGSILRRARAQCWQRRVS